MSALRIEHVNVTVADPERTAALMEALFDWRVRWRGPALNGGRSVHVGSGDHYIAFYADADGSAPAEGFAKGRPLNHIGVEVDDLDDAVVRVAAAGLTAFNHGDYHPGRRFYFFDLDGVEYEVVSYAPRL